MNGASCNCGGERTSTSFRPINVQQIQQLTQQALQTMGQKQPAVRAALTAQGGAPPAGVSVHLHVTPEGDALVTVASAAGNNGDVVLQGTLFGVIPYEIHINVKLENTRVTVTLQVVKPLPLGPFEWNFDLTGVLLSNGQIVSAAGIVPSPTNNPAGPMLAALGGTVAPQGLGWVWCVLKCGGLRIIGTLVECLPALSGGPGAYIACVVGKLGLSDAAAIAKCVAEECR